MGNALGFELARLRKTNAISVPPQLELVLDDRRRFMRRAIVSWKKLAGRGNFVDSRHRHRGLRGSALEVQ
jgi:hypothetical protein